MDDSELFGVTLITLAGFALWLHLKCRLVTVWNTILETPHFTEWVMSLIVFLVILALIGEPASSYLAGVTVLGLVYMDYSKNGPNNFFNVITGKTTS